MFRLPNRIFILFFSGLIFIPCFAFADNLAFGLKVSSNREISASELITDDKFLPEGAPFDSLGSVLSRDPGTDLVLSLKVGSTVKAILLQADWNDEYRVSGSMEGVQWKEVWKAEEAKWGQGLRKRFVVFTDSIPMNFIKISLGKNDGVLSLSEVQVFDILPKDWSSLNATQMRNTPMQWWSLLSIPSVEYLRMALAAIALMILCFAIGRNIDILSFKGRVLLAIFCFVVFSGWSNFFNFHWGSLIHRHDVFHYYLGSKYSPELGYNHLYACSVIADKEDGFWTADSPKRTIRNLETNAIEGIQTSLESTNTCIAGFSPERWKGFKYDLSWFRAAMTNDEYFKALKDHGYNATPIWNLTGFLLTNLSRISTLQLNVLALLDPCLMLIAFGMSFKVFGLWPSFAALVYWATSFIASFAWTGGAFLRLDWLFYSMVGICFLKQKSQFAAGICLMMAGLVRIFPFAFGVGVVLKLLIEVWKTRSLRPLIDQKKFVLGAMLSLVVMLSGSFRVSGLKNWSEFIQNTTKHYHTVSTNMMGLSVVFAFSQDTRTIFLQDDKLADPFEKWKAAKLNLITERKLWSVLAQILLLVLMGRFLLKAELWQAGVIGMGFIFFTRLSNYDYYFLIPLSFLGQGNRKLCLWLMGLAWLSWGLPRFWSHMDDQYFVASVFCIGVYVGILLTEIMRVRREATPPV